MIPRILCWLVGHRWTYDVESSRHYVLTGEHLRSVTYCARCGAR